MPLKRGNDEIDIQFIHKYMRCDNVEIVLCTHKIHMRARMLTDDWSCAAGFFDELNAINNS